MEALIRADKISKDFSLGEITVHALKRVSFSLFPEEMIVILGPSGSGKSTMLNILGGIETATEGELYYEGEPLKWDDKKTLTEYRRRHIGFVFQFYNLMPGLTALENVELAAQLSADPLDPEELICQVGLGDRKNHFPSKLSGGQQQRVAIARALCKNPDILLCDEPTGALDSQTGVQILKLLSDFNHRYKKTVVVITHNQKIAQIADRVFFFKDGELEKIEVNETPRKPEEVDW
ncbi:MAG: ABC transporter ATP-binding protein [Lachnospiraceae bacterium]|jgi:putative ABC transport system ATP-binding protein|nr:ABC transporter ATP-binding protein [Lachnospiraceae bacterium]